MSYLNRHTNPRMKTQTEKLNDRQGKNDAGGYTFKMDKWGILRRFLVLGTEGGTYYVNENKSTGMNLSNLDACLKENGVKVVEEILAISTEGRAPKNDQAIVALAKASCHESLEVRKAAYNVLHRICRTGTHLFQFAEFRKNFGGGWGSLTTNSIGDWFIKKPVEKLALQTAKYKQRDGWSARDLLRLAHPKTEDREKNAVLKWVVSNGKYNENDLIPFLKACNQIKTADVKTAVQLIKEHRLPREVLPTEMLKEKTIWNALLEDMPMTAMIRNLGKMTNVGILGPNSDGAIKVCDKLNEEEVLKAARIHPINVLMAQLTYKRGAGVKGKLSWTPNQAITAAMEDAFYLSFKTVEATGKRTFIALDVSGSMSCDFNLNMPGFSSCMAATAMAMTTLRTEKHKCFIKGFASGKNNRGRWRWGGPAELVDLDITKNDSLPVAMRKAHMSNFGSTDCSLPMIYAAENKIPVDAFIVYTDGETYAGKMHVSEALKQYREQMKIDAKLIVCATSPSKFSLADPKDPNCMDIAGFDSATPRIIGEFIKGNI